MPIISVEAPMRIIPKGENLLLLNLSASIPQRGDDNPSAKPIVVAISAY